MKNNYEAVRRQRLLRRLEKCTDAERIVFVRMYGPRGATADGFMMNTEQIAKHNMAIVVENMDVAWLEWALKQVAKSLEMHDEE